MRPVQQPPCNSICLGWQHDHPNHPHRTLPTMQGRWLGAYTRRRRVEARRSARSGYQMPLVWWIGRPDGDDPMTRRRAPKADYQFRDRRAGDVVMLPDAKARVMYLSAFVNWMTPRVGSLKAKSKKTPDGYRITFTGISPAEAKRYGLTDRC